MTTIGGKQFRCPNCGGGMVREFSEAIVSCDIVTFGVADGWPFVIDESNINWEETISEPWYKCGGCERALDTRELPHMIAAAEESAVDSVPLPNPGAPDWHTLGSVTIDTGTLLLMDPVHAGTDVGALSEAVHAQVPIPGGDFSAVLVSTGMGDGRYVVEGRYAHGLFGRRIAEIRISFLGEKGEYLGFDRTN